MKQVLQAGIVILALGLAGPAPAEDKLILKDGQVVTGDIVSEGDTTIEIKSAEETIRVPTWAIETIERDGKGPQPVRAGAAAPAQASPAMQAWIATCVEHLGSSDDGVRGGAKAALRAAGPTARPALEQASVGKNKTVATIAQQLLAQLDRGQARAANQRSPLELQQERKTSKMVRNLGLDNEQRKQFEKIMAELHAGQRDVSEQIQSNELPRDEASSKMAVLREQAREKLTLVLNEEQMKQYTEMMSGKSERSAARKDAPAKPRSR